MHDLASFYNANNIAAMHSVEWLVLLQLATYM